MTKADRKDNTVTLQELEQLAQSLRATTISHIALGGKDWSVRMTTSVQPFSSTPTDVTPVLTSVRSPAPGLALLHHPLLEQHFTAPGQWVKAGDLLALIKMGVVYLPVRSPVSGRLESLLITQGQPVEFDQQLAQIQGDSAPESGL